MTKDISTQQMLISLAIHKNLQQMKPLLNFKRLTISKQEEMLDQWKSKVLSWFLIWQVRSTLRSLILKSKLMFKELGSIQRIQELGLLTMDKEEDPKCNHLITLILYPLVMVCGQYIQNLISQDFIEERDKMSLW